ncbi:anti-repressor SinI family protein [Metabacillus fastidiosus]|nr:anti-repressor SinI family protein [Metabacillus fastidiosus]
MNPIKPEVKVLDKEWEELILLALNAGITVEEIKEFFAHPSRPK